jgi:GT2 family glycosyltransferase
LNKISILIVNYNTDDLTIQAVDSVNKHVKEIQYEIIVVDNCSPKGTNLKNRIKKCPNTSFYQLDENIGFGRANNYAHSKSTSEYIFLLNSDAYLIDDSLERMIEFLDKEINKSIACLGAKILDENLELNNAYGKFYSLKDIKSDFGIKKKKNKISGLVNFDSIKEVDYIIGAAVLIRNSVIQKLSLFSPKYFMYYEDMDLAFRYKKNGYLSKIDPSYSFVHIGGQSGYENKILNFQVNLNILYSKYLYSRNFLPIIASELVYLLYIIQYLFTYSILQLKIFVVKKRNKFSFSKD